MNKKPSFDLLAMTGLRHKPPAPEFRKYAGMNRRMLAATIDSLLIVVFIAPLIDMALAMFIGQRPLDLMMLRQEMNGIADPQRAANLLQQRIAESGMVHYWLASFFWQTVALLLITGLCWHLWSTTPGKWLLRMRVVDAQTEARISTRQIFLRLIGYGVSSAIFFLGFFWIMFDKRRQGWHDKMAGTAVIITPRRAKSRTEAVGPSGSPAP